MRLTRTARATAVLGLGASMMFGALPAMADGPPNEWATQTWDAARAGNEERLLALLKTMPEQAPEMPAYDHLRDSVTSLLASVDKREAERQEGIAEVRKEIDDLLAGELDDRKISKALAAAVRLELLSHEHDDIMKDPQISMLVAKADMAANAAEARADWLVANELFYRLNGLLEAEATYKDDLARIERRLMMIQLYAPERLWQLRHDLVVADAKAEGEEPEEMPPYNPIGDDYHEKLSGINKRMLQNALWQAAEHNVELHSMRELLLSALDAIKMMITTPDLAEAFPALADERARDSMLASLDRQREEIRTQKREPDPGDMAALIERVLREDAQTVKIPETAVLHEFGNGAIAALDEFSGIIWPDEWSRFERNTRGSFVGVGIQIQMDEKQRIKVVTPLDGTPAQRLGVQRDDVITKVDGQPTWGFTLNQAVDVITGPVNTEVSLTIERKNEDGEAVERTFDITRKEIDLVTVKGWRRAGEAEDDWDWFVDPATSIGYVRLTNFDENTAMNFDLAVREMQRKGLAGLVLDLRYNPGGLLDQAVEIANRFIDVQDGVIVSTHYAPDQGQSTYERAVAYKAKLADLPTIVLINEGSASASEIVSGALKYYADQNQLDALVLGMRSYGKGSVQNVWRLTMPPTRAAVKITTQHYHLPDGKMIHRKPGSSDWGVNPHLVVDMLPNQIRETLTIRRNADLFDVEPISFEDEPATDDPDALLKGPDVQLQTALVLLESRILAGSDNQAMLDREPIAPGGG